MVSFELFHLQMSFSIDVANNLIKNTHRVQSRPVLMQQQCSWMGRIVNISWGEQDEVSYSVDTAFAFNTSIAESNHISKWYSS